MCYSTSGGGSYPTSPANSYAYRRAADHDHGDMHHAGKETKTKQLMIINKINMNSITFHTSSFACSYHF
jgi:hypothetical protein